MSTLKHNWVFKKKQPHSLTNLPPASHPSAHLHHLTNGVLLASLSSTLRISRAAHLVEAATFNLVSLRCAMNPKLGGLEVCVRSPVNFFWVRLGYFCTKVTWIEVSNCQICMKLYLFRSFPPLFNHLDDSLRLLARWLRKEVSNCQIWFRPGNHLSTEWSTVNVPFRSARGSSSKRAARADRPSLWNSFACKKF